MKKWTWILTVLLCVTLLASCGGTDPEGETPVTTEGVTADTTASAVPSETDEQIKDASRYITEEEAIASAAAYFGIESGTVDDATGYVMSYRVVQTPTEEDPYYVVGLQWLVTLDGEPDHQSMLDRVSVDAVSGDVLLEEAE